VATADREQIGRLVNTEQARQRPFVLTSARIAPAPCLTVYDDGAQAAEFLNNFASAGDET
jgi:hypothetical protein